MSCIGDIESEAVEQHAVAIGDGDANHNGLAGLRLELDEGGSHLIVVAGLLSPPEGCQFSQPTVRMSARPSE